MKLDKEYKLGKAYRYFSCQFVREIFLNDINSQYYILKCKVIPSQRVTQKPYDVWALVEKDTSETPGGEIMSGYCTCVAGLQGGCNHIAALLFRIESAVTTGVTNPSKTSLCCEWVIQSRVKIDITPTKAEELFFSNSKYTSNKDKYDKQKHRKQKFANYKPSSYKKHNAEIKKTRLN